MFAIVVLLWTYREAGVLALAPNLLAFTSTKPQSRILQRLQVGNFPHAPTRLSSHRNVHPQSCVYSYSYSTRSSLAPSSTILSSPSYSYVNHVTSSTRLHMAINDDEYTSSQKEMMALEQDIERMKEEALQKLNSLNNQLSSSSSTTATTTTTGKNAGTNGTPSTSPSASPITTDTKSIEEAINGGYDPSGLSDLRELEENMMDNLETIENIAVSNNPKVQVKVQREDKSTPMYSARSREQKRRSEMALLDDTVWKISLNIGRERGTWMPEDWGVSGERLLLSLELEFTDNQLFEREDFLGSIGDAKVCKVRNNELILSPSITEGRRTIKVKDGGWRVVKGAGPKGTDLLRFYIETYQDIRRDNEKSDIYCPSGRIYCSCGYFPTMTTLSSGIKDRCKRQLDAMIEQETKLEEEIASMDGFTQAIDKVVKSTKLFRLRVEMAQVVDRYNDAAVTEPDSSILQFSQDGNVGLTKEGGVCCKVEKGIAMEYHILGKFSLASRAEQK